MAEGNKGKVHFREATAETKTDHQMMDTAKGYLKKIAEAAMNDGNAYLILSDNMSDIVANNTT